MIRTSKRQALQGPTVPWAPQYPTLAEQLLKRRLFCARLPFFFITKELFNYSTFLFTEKPQCKRPVISPVSWGATCRDCRGALGSRQQARAVGGWARSLGTEDWMKAPELCFLCPISIQTTQD